MKKRPVVVVSINDINRKPLVVTVIPGSTWSPGKPVYRHSVKVEPTATNGLKNPTLFRCFQIKAIDHSRFVDEAAGILAAADLRQIEEAIQLCLGLP